jgi:hypothetical protein
MGAKTAATQQHRQLIPLAEAAQRLGIKGATLRKAGGVFSRLPRYRIGRLLMYDTCELDEFIDGFKEIPARRAGDKIVAIRSRMARR